MSKLTVYATKHKYLFWDIPRNSLEKLSHEAILERTLAYADMPEIYELFKTLGIKEAKKYFEKISIKRRKNLKPSTINYFRLYFKEHDS